MLANTLPPSAPAVRLGLLPSRPKRLLLVTARYFPMMGGVETHVHEVGQRFAQAGYDVTVLTTDPTGALAPEEMVAGMRVRRVRAYPAQRDYYFAPAVRSVIANGGFDVVHVQGAHTLVAPLAMHAARAAGVPYVLTFHTGGHPSRLRNLARAGQWRLLRPLFAGAERLIGVSRFEADFFQGALGLPRDRFTVIPNGGKLPQVGADALKPLGTSDPEKLIVSVGRLERYKGHHRVIAALPIVRERFPEARARIVGAGPYESELRGLARVMGVANHVEIGPIAPSDRGGMAAALGRADLVTLLSDYEAHPIAAMEALAIGRPLLVGATSGLREFAERGLARDIALPTTPERTAAAIVRQLEEPLVPRHVELPTWEGCVERLAEVYAEAFGARRLACAS